jgi:hypothetical protein
MQVVQVTETVPVESCANNYERWSAKATHLQTSMPEHSSGYEPANSTEELTLEFDGVLQLQKNDECLCLPARLVEIVIIIDPYDILEWRRHVF